jgi:predicted molibdopterin-dependent oxidoreductase YjgC
LLVPVAELLFDLKKAIITREFVELCRLVLPAMGYISHDNLSNVADIVFPAVTWGEEYDVGTNGERRLRLYQKFYDALGNNAY